MKDKNTLVRLFAALPGEPLPAGLEAKIMQRVSQKALLLAKRRKRQAFCLYAAGICAMIAACILALHFCGVSLEFPAIRTPDWKAVWTFPKTDFDVFKSPFFAGGVCVGMLGLLLLFIDDALRRFIGKLEKQD